MHELSLASSIRDLALQVAEDNRAARIRRVCCRIGAMRQVVPSMMHTAFQACCTGTKAEGCELAIDIDPVRVTCAACGAESRCDTIVFQCPACDSIDVRLAGGTEMAVTSIRIDQEDGDGDHRPAERAGAQSGHG